MAIPVSGTSLPATRLAAKPDPATTEKLEAAFIGEMLKYLGPTGPQDAAAGGGESQFQSFLDRYRAEALASRLDLGLSPRARA